MKIAIIGAGVSGLGAAITLAHDGHDVVILERDATPLPETSDEAFEWNRKSAPQVRHSHAFLARGRNVIRDRLPELRDALLAAGATEIGWSEMLADADIDRTPQSGDEDLVMLACRRTTFEWVQRRVALGTDRVELHDGVSVTGLLSRNGSGGVPTVTGVRCSDGDLDADVVVDATGRPGHLPQMLTDIGVTLTEDRSDANIVYTSRFYRLLDGAAPPTGQAFYGVDLGDVKCGIMRGDNRTFSITLAYFAEDTPMRALREEDVFDRIVAMIPAAGVWVDPAVAEPISPVHYMGGLINRVRHYVLDDEPIVGGLHAIGDSSVCTNPLYGRGCSLGLLHGVLLSEAIREYGDDHRCVALTFDQATKRELVPWYTASVAQDSVQLKLHRKEELSEFDAFMRSLINDGLFPAAGADPGVARAWMRTFNLLTSPDALFNDPGVTSKVMEFWNDRENREAPARNGPSREELLDAIAN